MATILDVGLLQSFSIIFPVLLVFAILFAILQKTKAVSESVGINSVIAIAAAFMVLLSDTLVQIINFIVPWFVVVIIFLILMILIFQVFGAGEADVKSALKDKVLMWTLIGIGIVLILAALGNVLGQSLTEAAFEEGNNATAVNDGSGVATSSFSGSVRATLFHPKVLGLIVIFIIAIFAVAFLSGG